MIVNLLGFIYVVYPRLGDNEAGNPETPKGKKRKKKYTKYFSLAKCSGKNQPERKKTLGQQSLNSRHI